MFIVDRFVIVVDVVDAVVVVDVVIVENCPSSRNTRSSRSYRGNKLSRSNRRKPVDCLPTANRVPADCLPTAADGHYARKRLAEDTARPARAVRAPSVPSSSQKA